ncbi:MAG: hypothetical protein MI745_06125, partial [Pseudomonadales bacterium]|nr:hypothetical protein [Pseudomonadales bacterium]
TNRKISIIDDKNNPKKQMDFACILLSQDELTTKNYRYQKGYYALCRTSQSTNQSMILILTIVSFICFLFHKAAQTACTEATSPPNNTDTVLEKKHEKNNMDPPAPGLCIPGPRSVRLWRRQ